MRIGIFGLSGVGKSYLVDNFVSAHKDFIGTKASQLISEASNEISFDILTPGIITNNQKALILGFENFCQRHTNKNILIELHNIIELPNEIVEIEDKVLYSLNLNAACFLFSNPKIILDHRTNDTSRLRPEKSITDLKNIQNNALLKFKATFSNTKIPFETISEHHQKEFNLFVHKLEQKLCDKHK